MATKKELVTDENFEELLLKSVDEVSEYIKGEKRLRTHKATYIKGPEQYSKTKIKKIRSKLGLSQAEFSRIFGVTTSAVQHWEQGIRSMPSPACRLLNLIEKDSDTIFDLILDEKAS